LKCALLGTDLCSSRKIHSLSHFLGLCTKEIKRAQHGDHRGNRVSFRVFAGIGLPVIHANSPNSAGVSGLTCAFELAKRPGVKAVTVVAKHMPGDYDIEYTSPWAGANVLP
jgi:hypothetical protein